MTIAQSRHIPELRRLWKVCFPDVDDGYLNFYFSKGFPLLQTMLLEDQCHKVISMLTVIPANITGKQGKFAYIYAVGTDPDYRGRGMAAKLMQEVECYLKKHGYQAAMLFPAENGLYAFYERLGYVPEFFISELSGNGAALGSEGVTISSCDKKAFLALRQHWLARRGESMTYPDNILGYVYDEAVYTGATPVLLSKNGGQDYALCYTIKQNLFVKETTMNAERLKLFLPDLCRYFGVVNYKVLLAPEKALPFHRHGMVKWFEKQAVMPEIVPYMNLVLD